MFTKKKEENKWANYTILILYLFLLMSYIGSIVFLEFLQSLLSHFLQNSIFFKQSKTMYTCLLY